MLKWSNILVPSLVAIAAGWFVGIAFWDTSKQAFLVGLSVIAAGVLVRLARGLPFTAADHYEVDEIRGLTNAMRQIVRSLRILITAVLLSMLGLVIAKPFIDTLQAAPKFVPYISYIEHSVSGALGFVLTYVSWRMLQVVKGDQDLTELQSKFIVRAVERRQAKIFDQQQADTSTSPFKSPEGYGRRIQ